MPIELASIAQAAKPSLTMRRNAACSSTGSGVVRPVARMVQSSVESPVATGSGNGGTPMPSVPTKPARRPSRFKVCAVHHAVEVLPLVPVVATTFSAWLGSSKNAAAIWPVAFFIDFSVAMRASSKPNASTSFSSTRHVEAPASSAAATKRRPSLA